MHWFTATPGLFDIMAMFGPEAIKELQVLNGILPRRSCAMARSSARWSPATRRRACPTCRKSASCCHSSSAPLRYSFEDVYGRNRPGYQGPAQLMASDLARGDGGDLAGSQGGGDEPARRRPQLLLRRRWWAASSGSARPSPMWCSCSIARNEPRYHEVIRDPVTNGQLSINVAPGDAAGAMVAFLLQSEERIPGRDRVQPLLGVLPRAWRRKLKIRWSRSTPSRNCCRGSTIPRTFGTPSAGWCSRRWSASTGWWRPSFEFARNPSLRLQQCDVNDTVRSVLASVRIGARRHAIVDQSYDPEVRRRS